MSSEYSTKLSALALIFLIGLVSGGQAMVGATIVIQNGNAAGVGFNDPTPVAPVGGNSGTTLGEQRLIAFQHAAGIWGSTLDSNVTIVVLATFEPLGPNILGSAEDFAVLNAGARTATGNRAIISAGTGLGEAAMYWDGRTHRPTPSEGGHADFAPRTVSRSSSSSI